MNRIRHNHGYHLALVHLHIGKSVWSEVPDWKDQATSLVDKAKLEHTFLHKFAKIAQPRKRKYFDGYARDPRMEYSEEGTRTVVTFAGVRVGEVEKERFVEKLNERIRSTGKERPWWDAQGCKFTPVR